MPSGREESWRFTPLSRLGGLHDGSAAPAGSLDVEWDAAPGVTVELVGRDDPRLGRHHTPTDRAAAEAWARFEVAIVITLTSSNAGVTSVRLRGRGGAAYGHVLIEAEREAAGTVVLDHAGAAAYSANVEIALGDLSHVSVVTVQDWDAGSVHLSQDHAFVGRDATYSLCVVTLGGDVVRLQPQVDYLAPGGSADLVGVFFAGSGQHLEHRSLVEHAQPHCRSNVVFKGALQGESARTVWVGDVVVRRAAVGIETYEINRNLLLTDGARADSVPNLELETGDVVGAGHASATGRFDDEQLFYLQSRGIDEIEARRLVVQGFFADVIQRIGLPELQDRLSASIDGRLAALGRAVSS